MQFHCYNLIYTLLYKLILFAMLVDNYMKTKIDAAFKSIQGRTCIKFKKNQLTKLYTSAGQTFPVVFRKAENRYTLYTMYVNRKIFLQRMMFNVQLIVVQVFQMYTCTYISLSMFYH